LIHLTSIDLYALAAVFLFGLIFGSFLNVCIYRIPLGKSIVRPNSACPNCGRPVRPYDNIPVLSWLLLRGRCRNCKAKISPRYLLVELLTGVMFAASYLHANSWLEVLKLCIFSFLVIGLIFIDAEHHLLPDKLTLPGFFLGLAFSLVVPVQGVSPGGWILDHPVPLQLFWSLNALLGAVVGGLFIYAAGELYFRLRGIEGMGFGDVKFMAMTGSFLGMKLTLFTIFAASLLGALFGLAAMITVWRKRARRRLRSNRSQPRIYSRSWQSAQLILRNYEIPFGVFLGSMALASIFIGQPVMNWYMSFYR
jgi:leader peptidase (prepilin peptidase) / N-methyltransferase